MNENITSESKESQLPKKELLGRILAGSVSIVIFYFLQIILKKKLTEGVPFPIDIGIFFLLSIIYFTLIVWILKVIQYIYWLIKSL